MNTCDRCHQHYEENTTGRDGYCPACAEAVRHFCPPLPDPNATTWAEARACFKTEFSVRLTQEAERFETLAKDCALKSVCEQLESQSRLALAHVLRAETFRAAAALIAQS